MDYEQTKSYAENIHSKLLYVYEHNGSGSKVVHDAGLHACIVLNYIGLMTKEYTRSIMKDKNITWETYAEKLNKYIEKAEVFLEKVANNSVRMNKVKRLDIN